jgi:peptidyl-prolyl cis-trans isomerase SurA
MTDDYARIQQWALQDKKLKAIGKWINEKAKDTYIKIIDSFDYCDFVHKWMEM